MDSHVDDRIFGTIIAYAFPGMVILWGAGYVSDRVSAWLDAVAKGDGRAAGFLLLTVLVIGLGVCANAARWYLLEVLLKRWYALPEGWLDHSKRKDDGVERAYQNANLAHYRFYQHAGNTLVAVVFAYLMWMISGPHGALSCVALTAVVALAIWILGRGAHDAQLRDYRKAKSILGLAPGEA